MGGFRTVNPTFMLTGFGIIFLLPTTCFGHALNPGVLEFNPRGNDVFFQWSPPEPATSDPVPGQERIAQSGPIFEDSCSIGIIAETANGGFTGTVSCNNRDKLGGEVKGLKGLPCEVIVVLNTETGFHSQVLRHEPRIFDLDLKAENNVTSWSSYLQLGTTHISEGFDHLLFVAGLLLLLGNLRSCILALTSFTIGHGISMALYTGGDLVAQPALVETLISLSLISLALEVLRKSPSQEGLFRRFPWGIALLFGLIHGLGFAGALMEIGLPEDAIWPSLLAFNLGVELGQLVFAGVLFMVLYGLKKQISPRIVEIMAGYGIGIMGIFWTMERGIQL